MKIDFSQIVKSLSGEPYQLKKDTPARLGDVSIEALLAEQKDVVMTGADKLARWELSKKLHGESEIDVSAEEISLIKKAASGVFSPSLMGAVYDLLEA